MRGLMEIDLQRIYVWGSKFKEMKKAVPALKKWLQVYEMDLRLNGMMQSKNF